MNPLQIGDKTSRFDSVYTVMGAHLANMKNPAITQYDFLVHESYHKCNPKPATTIFSP